MEHNIVDKFTQSYDLMAFYFDTNVELVYGALIGKHSCRKSKDRLKSRNELIGFHWTIKDIKAKTFISKGTIHKAIRKLEKEDLLKIESGYKNIPNFYSLSFDKIESFFKEISINYNKYMIMYLDDEELISNAVPNYNWIYR